MSIRRAEDFQTFQEAWYLSGYSFSDASLYGPLRAFLWKVISTQNTVQRITLIKGFFCF